MAQSAQSHSQMRSIPHCVKAVFYVFVFHSIHNSAIKYNHCPLFFSTEPLSDLSGLSDLVMGCVFCQVWVCGGFLVEILEILVGECDFFYGKNLEIGGGIINFVIQKFIENSATSKLIGILFKLNEIPSKRPFSNGGPRPKGVSSDTGGLQRCGCPQILYLSEFHHIPLMWLHIEAMARVWHTSHELSLFLSYLII